MSSGGVAEKKAKKELLEEEMQKTELPHEVKHTAQKQAELKPVYSETEKSVLRESIVRVAAEKAVEEKIEAAEEEKRSMREKPASEINVRKPEKGLALEAKAAEAKARDYRTREEVMAEETRLETKAVELKEKEFEEQIREEKAHADEAFGRGSGIAGKAEKAKAPAPKERIRVKRPPTFEEKRAEEEKAHKLAVLRRKDKIRKELEEKRIKDKISKGRLTAKERMDLAKRIIQGDKMRTSSVLKKLKDLSKLLWK